MAVEFSCPYCMLWQPKTDFDRHMYEHISAGDDIGTIAAPRNWREFARRFAPLGLYQVRGEPDDA